MKSVAVPALHGFHGLDRDCMYIHIVCSANRTSIWERVKRD